MLTEIDYHIVNRASGAAHDFGLRVRRRLIMHTSQRPPTGIEGNTALNHFGIQSMDLEFVLAPSARKKPSVIGLALEVNFDNSRNPSFMKLHAVVGRRRTF